MRSLYNIPLVLSCQDSKGVDQLTSTIYKPRKMKGESWNPSWMLALPSNSSSVADKNLFQCASLMILLSCLSSTSKRTMIKPIIIAPNWIFYFLLMKNLIEELLQQIWHIDLAYCDSLMFEKAPYELLLAAAWVNIERESFKGI